MATPDRIPDRLRRATPRRAMPSRARVVAAALAPLLVAGPLRAQAVAEIQVSPQTMTLAVGQRQTIFAAAFDRQGNLIPNARFTFWTSDSTVARVGRDGTVVGLKAGLAKVEARAQGRRASVAVLVSPRGGRGRGADTGGTAPPQSAGVHAAALTLDPVALRMLPGETARLTPEAVREDGSTVPLGRVAWKSLRSDVARVDSAGTVTAVAPGRTVIQAAAGGALVATAPVEVDTAQVALSETALVLPPEGFDTLRLTVPSQANRPIAGGIQWRSTDTTVARVGPTGIVQAVGPGTADIVASGFFGERRVRLTVYRKPQILVVTPRTGAAVQIPLGQSRRFSAVAQAADSTPIPEVAVHWEVGDTGIAAFEPGTGTLLAKALGTTSLTARLPGFAPAVWAIEVVPASLRLDRSRLGLAPGQRAVVVATLQDDRGRAAGTAAELRWISDRPDVVAVDPRGTVQALGLGRAVVTAATPWGATARLEVFVAGDLLFATSRRGTFGIYQASAANPDSLVPLLVDAAVNVEPALSPDRTRIAFSSNRANRDGNYDLYVMDADGRNIRRLTTERGTDGDPAWTPDGSRIVFSSARSGVPQIMVIPADSGEAVALTSSPGGNHSPAVSPDGKTIAFVSLRDGGPRIYRMNADGTGQTRVTAGSLREAVPRFFPNGDLAYAVERSPGSREWRIVRLPARGAPVTLLQVEQRLVTFAPSPDGERLVYVTLRQAPGGRPEYAVYLRSLGPAAVPLALRLQPGEQVASATF